MDLDSLRKDIDTIAIVMLENRSFDHLLGFLSHEDFGGRSEVDGLRRSGPDFAWRNADSNGRTFRPQIAPDDWLSGDPPHGRDQIAEQLGANLAMAGFVRAYQQRFPNDNPEILPPMRAARPADVPVTAALADHYCVCDRWFSPLPADTQVNRNMAISGYSLIDTSGALKPPLRWLPAQTTLLDWLESKGLPFEIYVDAPSFIGLGRPSNFIAMPSQWRHLDSNAFGLDDLGTRWRRPGKGPAVVFCEPYYDTIAKILGGQGNCNHPPLPLSFAEMFLRRVYQSLTSNPDRWKRTVLIVCYDEHGGFFDHVAPPRLAYAPPANAQWKKPDAFATLGIRVPALVISPYVERRAVCHQLFDHTSMLQLLVERFGTSTADLEFFGATKQRKEHQPHGIVSLLASLTRDSPRDDVIPLPTPSVPLQAQRQAAAADPSDDQEMFAAAIRAKVEAARAR